MQYPDTSVKQLYSVEAQSTVRPSEVGVYTVVMKGENDGNYADFFVHISKEEMEPKEGGEINISLVQKPEAEKEVATSGIWYWLALAFLLILLLEWEWYYYEQY